MIVTHIEGRLRIRHEELRSSSVAAVIGANLKKKDIMAVLLNQKAGSILITYNPALAEIDKIIGTVEVYLGEE